MSFEWSDDIGAWLVKQASFHISSSEFSKTSFPRYLNTTLMDQINFKTKLVLLIMEIYPSIV